MSAAKNESDLNSLLNGRRGLPKDCLEDTYKALRPIFEKYASMKKTHMNEYRIIGIMYQAFKRATRPI